MAINFNTLKSNLALKPAMLLALFLTGLASCQSPNQADVKEPVSQNPLEEVTIDSAKLAARRPAPEFYVITPDIYKKRVYVCDDQYSDVFHNKFDCEVLNQCNATKRNVTLLTAIRDYGRYNCEVCTPELNHVFDENLVR